jgi:hypothetical protein
MSEPLDDLEFRKDKAYDDATISTILVGGTLACTSSVPLAVAMLKAVTR